MKVGDIIYASGGYNRTYVEFYEITKMTEKRMEIALLENNFVSGDPLRVSYVEPSTEKTGDVEKAFLNKRGHWCIMGRTRWQPRGLHKYEGKPIWSNTGFYD